MKAIGLSEAKAKFSEICEQVAAKGEGVLITRRGKPFVKIEPLPASKAKSKSVWERRAQYVKMYGPLTDDFTLPERR